MKEKINCIYILRCSDNTLYTGWTNNLDARLKAHNDGTGAKYTKARRPVTLLYQERCETKEAAMKLEYAIKKLTRKEKLAFIEEKSKSLKSL